MVDTSQAPSEAVGGKPTVFFVLGGPGAGKGTQCAKLVEHHGFVHLSAGDLLRAEKATGSETAELIAKIIAEGAIVPVAITCGLIKKAMELNGWAAGKFLVDGFPRNDDNLQGWNEAMSDSTTLAGVLHFVADEQALIERVMERGKTSGRTDDNMEVLQKRINQYKTEQIPIINHYNEQGLVKTINGNQSPQEVYNTVKQSLTGYI